MEGKEGREWAELRGMGRERACSVGTWVNRAVSAMQGGRTKRERDLVTYAVGALADGLLDFLVLGSNRRHVVFELAA